MFYGVMAEFAALALAAAFTGMGLAWSAAVQPALATLDEGAVRRAWSEARARAAPLELLLIAGAVAAAGVAWLMAGAALSVAGAAMLLADLVWVGLVMGPVGTAIAGPAAAEEGDPAEPPEDAESAKSLVARWGRLHAVRPALGGWASLFILLSITLG